MPAERLELGDELDSFERAELDTLRDENDTLRRKLLELESRLEAGIEKAVAAATEAAVAGAPSPTAAW